MAGRAAERTVEAAAPPPARSAGRASAVDRRLDLLEQTLAAPAPARRSYAIPVAIVVAGVAIAAAVMTSGGRQERALAALAGSVAAAETAAAERHAATVAANNVESVERAIATFLPYVLSDDPATVRKGFGALTALGHGDLAGRLAALTNGKENAAALSIIAAAPEVDETARTAAREALEAVVVPSAGALAHVVVAYRAGDGLDLRSNGFVIDPRGYLVTTVHPYDTLASSVLDATVYFGSSQAAAEGIRASYVAHDQYLALLKLDGASFPAMPVSRAAPPAVDEFVTVMGFRSESPDPEVSPGRVSAQTPEGNLLIDAMPGMAIPGAPVFNGLGEVVAVTRVALGQPLGTAIPIARALDLMPISARR